MHKVYCYDYYCISLLNLLPSGLKLFIYSILQSHSIFILCLATGLCSSGWVVQVFSKKSRFVGEGYCNSYGGNPRKMLCIPPLPLMLASRCSHPTYYAIGLRTW